jgi:peptidyl-tRNA hydrolase, PTH1 family
VLKYFLARAERLFMKFLIGLGNPGDQYKKVRHNLGFVILDEYTKKHSSSPMDWEVDDKFKAQSLKLSSDLRLIKPQTYMNNSGLAISRIANYFKVLPQDLIVVHDDLDLPLGKIKVRIGGAAGGHHGVESIIKDLGTPEFIRIRVGIGNQQSHSGEHERISFAAEKFVLEPFTPAEKTKLKKAIKQSLEAIDLLLEKGLEKAQNQYN